MKTSDKISTTVLVYLLTIVMAPIILLKGIVASLLKFDEWSTSVWEEYLGEEE